MADTEAREKFKEAVNMTASELDKWLRTDESTQAGQHRGGGESTGHESGRRIVQLLHTKAGDLTEDDERHMTKVAGYVARHLAQRPKGDVTDTTWRHSLMNWGHDPLKD
ncbi:MAG: DUF3140 domain-containing protein [Jatrophihabitans sp.]|uniref:DUF3140 domain-containing protein n=1 Tax=Jatrophihabitans sp. TaxID=1932789 RepID=UPI003F7FDD69